MGVGPAGHTLLRHQLQTTQLSRPWLTLQYNSPSYPSGKGPASFSSNRPWPLWLPSVSLDSNNSSSNNNNSMIWIEHVSSTLPEVLLQPVALHSPHKLLALQVRVQIYTPHLRRRLFSK